jgi:phosphoribosylpyrophosphate synthetase
LLERGVKIIVTDTIHTNKLDEKLRKQLLVIPTAPLFAEAIRQPTDRLRMILSRPNTQV